VDVLTQAHGAERDPVDFFGGRSFSEWTAR
jgi:hypothetical protein